MNIADYILPAALIALMAVGVIRRVPVFDAFVTGAKEALKVVVQVFPYLAAIFVCIVLFRACGLEQTLTEWLSPLLQAVGIPAELAGLVLIKPLSGSGATAALSDILARYGADSYIGRCAAVMTGCGETVLYVAAVYLGTVREKKLGYGLPVALIATLAGAVFACWMCRVI